MRLIDADRLKETLQQGAFSSIRKVIDREPTIDAEPVVHAHWNKPYWGGSKQECSNCHCTADLSKQGKAYCSYCGAKMDEEVKK